MTPKSSKARIRLELTECQKEQIRKATGRKVNALELGLQGLPEPAEPPAPEEERQTDDTGRRSGERWHDTTQARSNPASVPATRGAYRKDEGSAA